MIAHVTEEERAWLKRALQDPYELDEQGYEAWRKDFEFVDEDCTERGWPGFGYRFDSDSEWGEHLWVYSESDGIVENVIALVQEFLSRFRPGESWSITWASTCSKPCVGEFGGGWAVVTPNRVDSGSTWGMISNCQCAPPPTQVSSEEEPAQSARPCPYCNAPMGEPEMDHDQDESSAAVWRCPKCGAEEHITRYPPDEGSEPDDDGDEVDVCPQCGSLVHGSDELTSIADHGHCCDCHKRWQLGKLPHDDEADQRLATCQNCGEQWLTSALHPIRDIEQRVAPGEPMPAGECPACGALCHHGGDDARRQTCSQDAPVRVLGRGRHRQPLRPAGRSPHARG